MGLKYRPTTIFNPAWVAALRGTPESAMAATVLIYDPNSSGRVYNPDTDTWTDVQTPVWTGKARVQPLRSANNKDQPGNETTVQTTLVSIPVDAVTEDFRPGLQMDVLTAPLNPALLTYQFVLQEIMDSSNPLERTLMFTVDQETVNG